MLNSLKKLANVTLTENGAVTPRRTESCCLDLFATIGALRNASEDQIRTRFSRAYLEDPDIAMKTLFYSRDVRGGLGERRVFREILKWLAENRKTSLLTNLEQIPEFGRWDDILVLLDGNAGEEAGAFLKRQFKADMDALAAHEKISLLGKWLPSVNASCENTVRQARRLARVFGMRCADYRKALSALRAEINIIENSLRREDYTFDYAKQPSGALFKYRRAFMRHDGNRYKKFLAMAGKGEVVMHTGSLMPYDIVRAAYNRHISAGERAALDVTWNALEDFTGGENAIVVADGSGSMYCSGNPMPATVAQALAIYFAERNRGPFRGHFITFSQRPQLVEIRGRDIVDKVRYCETFNECADTNLQAVFELIVNAAIEKKASQDELPATLYIVSDMEFNYITTDSSRSNFEYARSLFESHGYKMPRVVFWNVNSRSEQQPVTKGDNGVILVSGGSARLFSQVVRGGLNPYTFMIETLSNERYASIRA